MKYSLKVVFKNKTEPTTVLEKTDLDEVVRCAENDYPDAVGYYIQKVED